MTPLLIGLAVGAICGWVACYGWIRIDASVGHPDAEDLP